MHEHKTLIPDAIAIGIHAYIESADEVGPANSGMDEARKLRLRRLLTSTYGLILGQPNTFQKDAAKSPPGIFFARMTRA